MARGGWSRARRRRRCSMTIVPRSLRRDLGSLWRQSSSGFAGASDAAARSSPNVRSRMGEVPAILSHARAMLDGARCFAIGSWPLSGNGSTARRHCVGAAESGPLAAARRGDRLCAPRGGARLARRRRSGDSRGRDPRHRRCQWRGQVDPGAHSRRTVAAKRGTAPPPPTGRRRARSCSRIRSINSFR